MSDIFYYFIFLSFTTFLTNKLLLKLNKDNYKKANYYFLAIFVQFIIILINNFVKNAFVSATIISNLMIAYFLLDTIFINFYCPELFSKILFLHHIISGFLVWIGINYGENYKYILDVCVLCEKANIWDNLLIFLTLMNIMKVNSCGYIIIRLVYIINFGYDRLIQLPIVLNEFLKLSNFFESFGIYCMYVIIIPMSFRLFVIKTISLIKKFKK